MNEKESIIRALAAVNCEVVVPTSTITDETATVCITCLAVFDGEVFDEDIGQWVNGPRDHTDLCPWRRARAWVEANPT